MSLCEYRAILDPIFGVEGKGVHSYRIANIAIVDVIATLILAYIISVSFNISYIYSAVSMFILGIILHRVFCIRTTVDKALFPSV